MSILAIGLGIEKFQKPKGTISHKPDKKEMPEIIHRKSFQQQRDEADMRWRSIFNGELLTRNQIKEAMGYKSEGGSLHAMKKRGKVASVFPRGAVKGRGNKQLFAWIGD